MKFLCSYFIRMWSRIRLTHIHRHASSQTEQPHTYAHIRACDILWFPIKTIFRLWPIAHLLMVILIVVVIILKYMEKFHCQVIVNCLSACICLSLFFETKSVRFRVNCSASRNKKSCACMYSCRFHLFACVCVCLSGCMCVKCVVCALFVVHWCVFGVCVCVCVNVFVLSKGTATT